MIVRHRLLVLAVLLLLFFAKAAQAQETLAPAEAPDATVRVEADDWWRPKPAPLRPKPTPKPLAVRFDGGYAPRRLFGLGVSGADMGFGLGVQDSHHFAVWWATRVSLGSTENGLDVWSGRTGVELEAVYDPLRFGIGGSGLLMGVSRAARDDGVHTYGVEARGFVRFDCWRTDDVALFLRAAIDGGVETNRGAAFWGPTLGAGVELGVRGKKRPEWAAAAAPRPQL